MPVALVISSADLDILCVYMYSVLEDAVKDMFIVNKLLNRMGLDYSVVIVSCGDTEIVDAHLCEHLSSLPNNNPLMTLAKIVFSHINAIVTNDLFMRLWQDKSEKEWRLAMLHDAMKNSKEFASNLRYFLALCNDPSRADWCEFESLFKDKQST